MRSYLPADHPDKGKEIGSEATPAEFVDVLLGLSAEWRRLLAPHGSLVVELGDTYSGSGGGGGDYLEDGWREGQQQFVGSAASMKESNAAHWRQKNQNNAAWPLPKSLTLIPEAYRFALAYGINPHTGQPSPAGQWRIRNVIRWVRPNPPVGALGDKFRPATSELVVACVSDKRWFDLDAVREPYTEQMSRLIARGEAVQRGSQRGDQNAGIGTDWTNQSGFVAKDRGGAPPLDWWKISPKGYAGAHYAVWPSELCVKPIQAMCPREVCRECGQPRRRITDVSYSEGAELGFTSANGTGRGGHQGIPNADKNVTTVGWSDCGHDDYRPGLVLDPFAGTGTTLAVAHGHGRDAIGIDIDERSAELARDRVGPLFLEVIF